MAKVISEAELAQHKEAASLWMVIDGDVYDVTKFARLHPGGSQILEQYGGADVTGIFYELHRKDVLLKYANLKIGRLASAKPAAARVPGEISQVPFSEIPYFQGQMSPYFKDSHKRLLTDVRAFVQTVLEPVAEAADLSGEKPDRELQQKLGMNGLMVTRMGPGPWLKEAVGLGIKIPGGVAPEEFDYFHEMLVHQELGRLGRPGFVDGLGMGWQISAPAVHYFANKEVRNAVLPHLLKGDRWSALSITEPFCGSDVAAVKTTAVKTPDGKHYIVNGIKKWITEGTYADYFVTAVRTGAAGAKGISMLLMERGDGFETKQMSTTYSKCCGTALVLMKNVKVPAEYLMGKEGDGFKQIMYNFNHERWLMVHNVLGQGRAAVGDTFMWAKQRKIFGKSLIDQPVIRYKLASAAAQLEELQSFAEAVTYTMCHIEKGPHNDRMGGQIALLKYQTTRGAWKIADDCVQVFGGRGITRTGMGAKVEGFKNYVKYAAVYGGSEEIMADLSVKQALKNYPAYARL